MLIFNILDLSHNFSIPLYYVSGIRQFIDPQTSNPNLQYTIGTGNDTAEF